MDFCFALKLPNFATNFDTTTSRQTPFRCRSTLFACLWAKWLPEFSCMSFANPTPPFSFYMPGETQGA
jgi:hypothetical protein